MQFEVEQKFRVADRAALERRLVELGASREESVSQVDQYFNHPSRDFARTDEALRLRRVGAHNCVTYKGPKVDATTKTRREIEIDLPPGPEGEAQAAEMLLALGFIDVARVSKQRTKYALCWQAREVTVALDEVAEVGSFVELEIIAAEADLDQARQCLAPLAEKLALANSERRSYLELLLQARE